MTERSQSSFTGGVISPELVARTDLEKVRVGAKTLENMLVEAHGALKMRPGTRFMIPCIDQANPVRLIPFEFSEQVTYVLEFGEATVRAHSAGGTLLQGPTAGSDGTAITSTTEGTPIAVNATGHGLVTDDYAWIIGSDVPNINSRWFKVTRVTDDQVTLRDPVFGNSINGTAFGVGTAVGKLYQAWSLPHLYKHDGTGVPDLDLFELGYTQSADTLTLTHDNPILWTFSQLPANWTRDLGAANHYFVPTFIRLIPQQDPPQRVDITRGKTGSQKFDYCVTSVSGDGEESEAKFSEGLISLAGNPGAGGSDWHKIQWVAEEAEIGPLYLKNADVHITAITNGNPGVITFGGTPNYLLGNPNIRNGDVISLGVVTGMTEVSERAFILANISIADNSAELAGEDTSGYGVYTGGIDGLGNHAKVFFHKESDHFNIYKAVAPTAAKSIMEYGFIGTSRTNQFWDDNIKPLSTDTPPQVRDPFDPNNADGPAAAVSYVSQRRIFGGTQTKPQTLYMSQAGIFHNFSVRIPLQDDDAITYTLSASKVNKIRHIVPLKQSIILTEGGEWVMRGDQDDVISPLTVNFEQHGTHGSSRVPPIIIGDSIIFIGPGGDMIRDLFYDFTVDNYKGNDLTILSRHLFKGRTIVDWAWQKRPDSIVWCVLDDGALVTLTYMREHEVWGWAHHTSPNARFESVASVAEGVEYGVYFVVRRWLDVSGTLTPYRFIEYLSSGEYTQVQDATHLDFSLTYNRPIAISAATQANPVVITLPSGHGLVNGDTIQIEDSRGMPELNGTTQTLAGVTSTTAELSELDGTGFGQYIDNAVCRKEETTFIGFWHLEGNTVDVLADGKHTKETVSNGRFTIAAPAARVHAGLRYDADVELLKQDFVVQGGVVRSDGRSRVIEEARLRVEASRPFKAGPNSSDLQVATFESDDDGWGTDKDLKTGVALIAVPPEWTTDGNLYIRQDTPLPLRINSITLELMGGM